MVEPQTEIKRQPIGQRPGVIDKDPPGLLLGTVIVGSTFDLQVAVAGVEIVAPRRRGGNSQTLLPAAGLDAEFEVVVTVEEVVGEM